MLLAREHHMLGTAEGTKLCYLHPTSNDAACPLQHFSQYRIYLLLRFQNKTQLGPADSPDLFPRGFFFRHYNPHRTRVLVDSFQQIQLKQEWLLKWEVNAEGEIPDCFTNSSPVLACA